MKIKNQIHKIWLMKLPLSGMIAIFFTVVAVSAEPSVRSQYLDITNQFASIDAVLYSQPGKTSPVGLVTSNPFLEVTWPAGRVRKLRQLASIYYVLITASLIKSSIRFGSSLPLTLPQPWRCGTGATSV